MASLPAKREGGVDVSSEYVTISRHENQARGIGQFAIDFMAGKSGEPSEAALAAVERFHLDSVACGVSALACGTNAPTLLRQEALGICLRRRARGRAGLRIAACACRRRRRSLANCAAVREWDANGTNFGYNPPAGHTAGEFGHNDFYPVAVAAAQLAGCDGRQTLRAMLLLDEIRGRLAEVFSLKTYKIDHVVHGAIASAAVVRGRAGGDGRADRVGHRPGRGPLHSLPRDPRTASSSPTPRAHRPRISAEVAVLSMRRAMRGFVGPADIFRNPRRSSACSQAAGARARARSI